MQIPVTLISPSEVGAICQTENNLIKLSSSFTTGSVCLKRRRGPLPCLQAAFKNSHFQGQGVRGTGLHLQVMADLSPLLVAWVSIESQFKSRLEM